MHEVGLLEWLLRRDRAVVLAGLGGVIALAWAYLLLGAGMDMQAMEMHAAMGMMPMAWSPAYALLVFVMWAVMMLAMMLPSAAPMVLLFAAISRRRTARGGPYVPTALFVFGYVVVWTAFALTATGLQWALEIAMILSPAMASMNPRFGGVVLLAAGLYQLTPLKHACLRQCRSPLGFVMQHWREGRGGAFRMGLTHGLYCLGCCWAVMVLLFVVGIMNLLWIAGIAAFVLAEKVLPGGEWIGRVGGVAMLAAGAALLLGG